ncbi:MAG: HEAT repeat domain-containing protein [Planctomycetia bacterium]|nr:HEAT repeat domain-containing protein [Planctomycetia bacterium]
MPKMDSLTDWYIYGGSEHKYDKLYGPLPAQRIETIRHMADHMERRSPDEQQRIAVDLASQIRTEGDPLVRTAILETLVTCRVPLAGQVLEAGMHDQSSDVRIACCNAWKKRGGPEAVKSLGIALSKDKNIDVRLAAASALGELHEPGVPQALAVALEDRQDPALQYRAVASLRTVTKQDLGNDVVAWRQYVQNSATQPATSPAAHGPTLAERVFPWWR